MKVSAISALNARMTEGRTIGIAIAFCQDRRFGTSHLGNIREGERDRSTERGAWAVGIRFAHEDEQSSRM